MFLDGRADGINIDGNNINNTGQSIIINSSKVSSSSGSSVGIVRSRSSSSSKRNRHRPRKTRKRSSTPTSLLLDNSDDDDDDDDDDGVDGDYQHSCEQFENCRRYGAGLNRPSPLPWSNDLHKDFVKAVFQVGIEESSPAVIAEQMITKNNYNTPDPTDGDDENEEHEATLHHRHQRLSPSATALSPNVTGDSPKSHDSPADNEACESEGTMGKTQYYKRELTGERLKSHLQKMRKQKGRETETFLKDFRRFLTRRQKLDRQQKEVERLEEQRREEAKRRKLKRKRSQQKQPSTLLDAFASDRIDDEFGRMVAVVEGFDEHQHNEAGCEDVTKDEEERLLSMYLPLRTSSSNGNGGMASHGGFGDDVDDDDDSKAGELDRNSDSPSAFPSGGKAIGMVTWAVQQQEIQDRNKRNQQQQQQQQRKMREDDKNESLLYEKFVANGWETASVDSWTSHTAIVAGKVATALGSGRRGASHPNPSSSSEVGERMVIDCASSEDGRVEENESDKDEDDFDHFRASIPKLTEAELNSPLGVSMRLTWDMIRYMHGVIAESRASKQVQQPHRPQKVPSARPCVSETQTPQRVAAAATTTMQQHPPPEPSLSSTNSHLLAAITANGNPPVNLMEALSGAVFGNLGKEEALPPPPPSALLSEPAQPTSTAAASSAVPFLVTPLSQPGFTTTEWDLARPPSTASPTF